MDFEELEFEALPDEELDLEEVLLAPETLEFTDGKLVSFFPPSDWEDFEDGFLGSLFSICLIISAKRNPQIHKS